MNSDPLVSIIVVTFNNPGLLSDCLDSLLSQTYRNIEVIAVDNGGKDETKKVLEAKGEAVTVISPGRNLGFAAGNNFGMESAKGDYVAIINDDAVASERWIESMVNVAESDFEIGQVASIIIDGNNPGVLDSCGMGITLDGMTKQAMHGKPIPKLEGAKDVLAASGCACMFRAKALNDVGRFDDDFFAYCEDSDIGLRLRFAGWKAVAAPGAEVTHFYSMTMGRYSLKKLYYVERNHYWVAVKNFPFLALLAIPPFTIWRYLVSAMLIIGEREKTVAGFKGEAGIFGIVSTVLKAFIDMHLKLPTMVKKRLLNKKMARLGAAEKLALLRRFRLPMKEILGAGD